MILGIGFPELLTMGLIGLVIFGPNRLPEVARGAARGIKRVRAFLAKAFDSLDEEAKGITDLATELQSLTPRGIVTQVLAPPQGSSAANSNQVRIRPDTLRIEFDPDVP